MSPLQWITGGDTGISSKTIWAVMMDAVDPHGDGFNRYDVPYDPSDFGRCYRLLNHFPEWKLRLGEVAKHFPAWVGLVREWDRLTALFEEEAPNYKCPKLYAAMKPLIEEGRIAGGWVQISPGYWKNGGTQ
jgi:hypothetical protein